MNQFLVSQLELNDPNWSSNTEVIQGSHGEITAVKITLVVKRRYAYWSGQSALRSGLLNL